MDFGAKEQNSLDCKLYFDIQLAVVTIVYQSYLHLPSPPLEECNITNRIEVFLSKCSQSKRLCCVVLSDQNEGI